LEVSLDTTVRPPMNRTLGISVRFYPSSHLNVTYEQQELRLGLKTGDTTISLAVAVAPVVVITLLSTAVLAFAYRRK